MSKIVVFTHLTLDGVLQAPGRADGVVIATYRPAKRTATVQEDAR
ncbi:MAG: hypothetical protein ACM37V_00220 [Gemmatimonadota bacterium]